ncbi:MAG: TauD/TfdA family dioxygenase [Deltaproteobacteria bacterium]|nr:TauD/TfdA family dioxygenase [Deltaproteobacteria bacterium]
MELIREVRARGFGFVSELEPAATTLEIGRALGTVEDIEATLPHSPIRNVQLIRPRPRSPEIANQYSGMFGFDPFPLHTDLAHWAIPPRYLALRCRIGARDVSSELLPVEALQQVLNHGTLARAVARPRKAPPGAPSCLLPLTFGSGAQRGFRWDSVFLRPVNASCRAVAAALEDPKLVSQHGTHVRLKLPGDLLVVDNWRALHGRSSVPATERVREIERIYLSELTEWA